jgi:plasmid stabilization system protein ParE
MRNFDHHANYIAKNEPIAARNAVQRIQAAVDQLSEYPSMGRIGRVPLTRELIVGRTRDHRLSRPCRRGPDNPRAPRCAIMAAPAVRL